MIIQHNMTALNADRQFGINNKSKSMWMERLSSGYRINRAADDAAGLAISEEMRGQIRGLNKGTSNIEDGMNFIQVADGAMGEMEGVVHRIRELAVQAANDTNVDSDRQAIQYEVDALVDELDRISDTSEYNTIATFQPFMSKVTYQVDGTTGSYKELHREIYKVKGNNYGITNIVGADHVWEGEYMSDSIKNIGSWNVTGNDYSWYFGGQWGGSTELSQFFSSHGFSDASIYSEKEGTVTLTSGKSTMTVTYGARTYDERPMLTGFSMQYYDTKKQSYTNIHGGGGYSDGTKGVLSSGDDDFHSAWIDFSGFGTDYRKEDLYGQGFATQCGTCERFYSIKFTDENYGDVNYRALEGRHAVLEINISGCESGDDLVSTIMNAVNNVSSFHNHYNEYGVNEDNPARLYIYDNRSYVDYSIFEPAARDTEGNSEIIGSIVHRPGDIIEKYEVKGLYIQMGANSQQGVTMDTPWLNARQLNLLGAKVFDHEAASGTIARSDLALERLNRERTKFGALYNRFEHGATNNDNAAENLQVSESRIRDMDLAKAMVENAKLDILTQAGISMMAQANQAGQGVLALLR